MKHVTTIPIFSNPLFIYKLDINEDLILKFKNEKIIKPSHNETSTEHEASLMTEELDILKKYKHLNKEINKAVYTTIKEILKLKNTDYKICNSWLTKSKPGQFSTSHSHRNSWLSGVYYPKGDPGFSIKFYHDNCSPFFSLPKEYNLYNSTEWSVFPEDNYLILFYSQLRHKIMPNQSNNDRFSLAFNVLHKGELGLADTKIIL
jgi:uncharacterized protein (TIGR02466 family)